MIHSPFRYRCLPAALLRRLFLAYTANDDHGMLGELPAISLTAVQVHCLQTHDKYMPGTLTLTMVMKG